MCTEIHHDHPTPDEVSSQFSRRGLLRTAAVGAAVVGAGGLLAAPASAAPPAASTAGGGGRGRVPATKTSIQLYTVRNQIAADFDGTLDRLAQIGYRRVEHAGFVGRTVQEFKAALDARGIRATSGHVGIPQPFDTTTWAAALADAKVLRSQYIVHPYFGADANGPIRDRQVWSNFAADLNRAGRMARQAGLQFGYHNHNAEFLPLSDGSGKTGYDILVEETDARYVHFEIDLYWAWRGAVDPVDLFRKVGARRVLQYHVKDMDTTGSFADPGTGLIDFGRIFQAHATDEYIVERDDAGSAPRTPADSLDTAAVGYDFLSTVRF